MMIFISTIVVILGIFGVLILSEEPGYSLICVFVVAIFTPMVLHEFSTDYKRGQIDALTGKVKCELKKQGNGELIWVETTPK